MKSEERRGAPQASRVLVSLRERRNIVDLSDEQVKSRRSRDKTNAAQSLPLMPVSQRHWKSPLPRKGSNGSIAKPDAPVARSAADTDEEDVQQILISSGRSRGARRMGRRKRLPSPSLDP